MFTRGIAKQHNHLEVLIRSSSYLSITINSYPIHTIFLFVIPICCFYPFCSNLQAKPFTTSAKSVGVGENVYNLKWHNPTKEYMNEGKDSLLRLILEVSNSASILNFEALLML